MKDGKNLVIGRYEVIQSLGRGSQGVVYLARDPALDRLVAIKVLTARAHDLNDLAEDGTPLEARMSGKLKHPNIVAIYDAGQCSAGPYLVFEYVEGKTLASILKASGAFSIEAALPLISGILQGLATAHASGILHLDLNPRNLLVDTGNVARVMDFGLSQYVNAVSMPGETVTGTLRYMAPEHFLGKPLGTWTDVFALGSTFYEMVTGQRAMPGNEVEQIQYKIVLADVDLAALRAKPHGEAFARFLQCALQKSREGRYANCPTMSEAFDLFLKETGLNDKASARHGNHSTIEFLLRRMQRKEDFPTISRTLSDINRLTGDRSTASSEQLANVVLRDFALTSKLLKLVNSAFYGTRTIEITSISQAIVFLGVEQLRMTANSLSFFGHMKGDSAVLKDAMTRSFLSGLISRHLARQAHLKAAEEAFICGMCQNLGETLVIYYFADDYADILELQASKQLEKSAASRGILGVSYADLGAAVARTWNLPASIVDAISGMPPGAPAAPESDTEKLRDFAVFSNRLCDLFQQTDGHNVEGAIQGLLMQFELSVAVDYDYCRQLVAAGYEKLKQYAPVFEIKVASSGYCQAVQSWLDEQAAAAAADGTEAKVRAS